LPNSRPRSINAEIQSIRRSLNAVVRTLGRLGVAIDAAARAPRGASPQPRRKLNLSPRRKAALKLQGQYIGHMRMLPAPQQARVKALRVKKGIQAAIRYARTLSQKRQG
jgi:hypothetical protein